ncbi:hypothetical protein M9H77_18340 [Catharanthus roseus]|uniref:Uncharacterized protein n=1 Tax=Catharanthus roseus TaxID=4058 RepID=A0ACC0B786_CATRO|nr:hypothetical protein M9H77_18340 [Catharanthus roseus]
MEKICLLFLAVLITNCLTLCRSQRGDESALLAFRSHITTDPNRILTNWTANALVCNWAGVSCNANQRVMALNLSGFGLLGTIAPHLGNLTFLTSLDIGHNNFSGSIPSELASLRSLSQIFLRYNQLTGTIPSGIFSLSSLEIVNMASNSLSGNLTSSVCNDQSKLRELSLSDNLLEGTIPPELSKCNDLEQLSLSSNQFTGRIPRELGFLSKLKVLFIEGNNFTGGIPLEIGNLTNLERLSMQTCNLTGKIPPSIFNISSLRFISLADNYLSGSLPQSMDYKLPLLEQLYLSMNELSGEIPPFVWESKNLVNLALSINNFTGGISRKIGNLTSLATLSMINNGLTGEIPTGITNLVNLEDLSLGGNNLSGPIPPGIFNISLLQYIVLSSNRLSGSLPSSIWVTLPNLEEIYLSNNKLSGWIPSFLSNASSLRILDLSSNSFSGPVPTTIGNLRFLQRFIIAENNLTRESSTPELTFITSLTNCRDLELVEMSLNQFDGFLPTSIGNFSSSLNLFKAFGCKIWGTIPNEIGSQASLTAIYLDSNELTGSIPSTVGKLQNVERIYLEHNRLQGPIPTELCQLPKLGDLYLSDNMLNGSIPDCLGRRSTLRRIYLQSNGLTSTIPSSLWSLNFLLGLNLSSNSLSGNVSPEIQNLKVITELDLSRNQLSGDIPSTLGSIQTLSFLSLAHNRFQGNIPESFGNMLSLESLDLSFNDLSGNIPSSLEKLGIKRFNVSVNRLEGQVPTSGCFANFTALSFLQNSALCGPTRLQLPPCQTKESSSHRAHSLMKYILPPVAAVILITAAIIFLCLRRKKEVIRRLHSVRNYWPHQWSKVSYQDLHKATDSFDESNLLGTGSFGSVYRGTLPDGTDVAVKVFHCQQEGLNKNFDAECEVFSTIRHRNLVRVYSAYGRPDFKALVLEYIPNGCLEKWLHSEKYFLDMLQRLNIAIDVASALEYLHHDHIPAVVHCDLKPANILLDEDMNARVCDFSIAKLFGDDQHAVRTKTLATIGYMAPEYGTQGIVSTSGDVYSYGVVLLEMFTKKKPTDDIFGEDFCLKRWVYESLRANTIMEIVDRKLINSEDLDFSAKEQCILSLLHIAMFCLTDSPQERITMRDVGARLERIKGVYEESVFKSTKID